MANYFQRIKFLLLAIGLLLFLYFDCRLLFFLFNKNYFPEVSFGEFLSTCFYGLRFDISAICFSNALFILLVAFPYDLFQFKWLSIIIKWLFIIVNTVAILANCSDFVYYKFINKRSTSDVFELMGGQSDFLTLLPSFLLNYWYVFIICIILGGFMVYVYNFFYRKILKPITENYNFKVFFLQFISFALIGGLAVLGMRGGFQRIPISIVNAGDNVENTCIPVVLNTPFSLMKSLEMNRLNEVNYFTDQELNTFIDPIKQPKKNGAFRNQNVVVIIVESLSTEYTKLGKRKSFTPFLDSLMDESLLCMNAIANGKRSIEGIPAILAGIPSLKEPYLNTIYCSNKIQSLANILKEKGYSASFFHGGTNGTMNFDSFAALAGFNYYGRTEYNNEKDYDGHWGIWDEPYLQYYVKQLNETKQPFVSSVFTLSAHQPFALPDKYKNSFPEGYIPILKCVAYSDYSLKQFFNAAKKTAWYDNTLFVITADHTGLSEDPFYTNAAGNYLIPIVYFKPDGSLKGIDSATTQQIDILPSILDYLHYDKPYFAFGNSVFDSSAVKYAVNWSGYDYQLFQEKYVLEYDEMRLGRLYHYSKDSLFEHDLKFIDKARQQRMQQQLKAFLQAYTNSLIHNTTSVQQ